MAHKKLVISPAVRQKLAEKHNVTPDEIEQCFANRTGVYLVDLREEHQSDPPTRWFIAQTDYGRELKIAFIPKDDGTIVVRSAFKPNTEERRIYKKFAL